MFNFGVPLFKSFVWLILTVSFGLLLPMVLVWVSCFFVEKSFPFEQFVRNGSLMFFATAVVASVTLDYILSEKFSNNWNWNFFTSNNWNLEEIFKFFIFPFFILILCIILFYISYFQPDMKIERLQTIELYYILPTILFYSGYVKFHAFK